MARKFNFPVFLPNKGVVLDKPEEFLVNNFSAYSRNMEFYNELLQSRLGLTKFSTTQLTGSVNLFKEFSKFDGTYYFVIGTESHLYSYDFSNKRFNIINKQYTAGTIEVQAGTPTKLRGNGTLWLANLKAGDYVKLGSGSVHTGSTYYKIDTVDSDILITLTTSAPTTAAGTAYVGVKTFTGTVATYWSSEFFVDKNLGEVLLFTNGLDTPCYWTGADLVVNLTGLATGFTTAKYLSVFANRVIFLSTVEGGQNQPQRARWGEVADCCDYVDTEFTDFMEEPTFITGYGKLANYHVIFKEKEAYVGRFVGGTEVFSWERSTSCSGCKSATSIVRRTDYLYYYGDKNKFYRWNLLREDVLSENIFPETKNFDPNKDNFIYGGDVKGKNQVRWFCPYTLTDYNNYAVVYDYKQEITQVWEYEAEQACNCIGEYTLQVDLYVDDTIWGEYYVDEQEGYWDEQSFISDAPLPLYGGYDGYIRNADSGITDDGSDYERIFRSSRLNYGLVDQMKRLQKMQIWLEAEIAGDVTIKLKKGDKVAFESDTHTVSLIDATKDIIKQDIRWDKEDENFQLQIESGNHFALLGFMSKVFTKMSSYDA